MARLFPCALTCFSILAGAVAQAGDCSQLPNAASAEDGQLYQYRAGGWEAVPPNQNLNLPIGRTATLTYVTREFWRPERSGVIVIKTGRMRQLTEPDARRTVMLVRKEDGSVSNKQCGDPPLYAPGIVTSSNYDAYHDRGEDTAQKRELDAFHVRYAARGKNCRSSNSLVPDAVFGWDYRSNRSQFSFDPKVVDGGMYSQVLLAFNVTTAVASSSDYIDQRVEIKRYNNLDQGPSCTTFKVMVPGRAAFLRINDLESVQKQSFARSQEKSWQLTP